MGDSSTYAGMWPEQASADDLRVGLGASDNAGAPLSMPIDVAFFPDQMQPSLQGNEVGVLGKLDMQVESPTLYVTISYIFASARRHVRVPWNEGLTVQRAIKLAKCQDSIFRLVGVLAFARVIGERRVHLHQPMLAGDVLRLNPTAKPFL